MRPLGCNPKCNACHHMDLGMAASLSQKNDWCRKHFAEWAEEIVPAPQDLQLGYRRNILLHCQWTDTGWKWGLLQRQEILAIPDCPLHPDWANQCLKKLSKQLPTKNFPLRYLAFRDRQLVLVLKGNSLEIEALNQLAALDLIELGLESLWINYHLSSGLRVFSYDLESWYCISGSPQNPFYFSQQISPLWKLLLDRAQIFLAPHSQTSVLDLYSGSGSSLKAWKSSGAETLGIELDGRASRACPQPCLQGKVEDRIPQIQQWIDQQKDKEILLYSNPPRMGMGLEVCQFLSSEVRPLRLAYSSCSQASQKRDIEIFQAAGYRVKTLVPYDFFPYTRHIETLILMNRGDVRQ